MESTRPLEAGAASLWQAPADPTRRRIRGLFRAGPAITGEIAATFPTSRIAVTGHLAVLAEGRTDRQSQARRGRRHCLNAVTLERLRRRWAGPVEAGFASGLLRLLRRAERWCTSRSGRSEGVSGDRVGRGWVAAESNSRAIGEPRARPAGPGSHRRKR